MESRRPISGVFREEYSKVLATVIRLTGDFQLAEDCVQEAFALALQKWVFGAPDHPGAWLTTAARNRAFDHLRRQKRWQEKAALVAASADPDPPENGEFPDDRLRLIFTCCHPA
ncbi:MAG: sigma factor, partial [Actinomycetota bacterium]